MKADDDEHDEHDDGGYEVEPWRPFVSFYSLILYLFPFLLLLYANA